MEADERVTDADDSIPEPTVGERAGSVTGTIVLYQIVGGVVMALSFTLGIFVFGIITIIVGLAIIYMSVRAILQEVEEMVETPHERPSTE